MTALTEPAAPGADEPPGPDPLEAWRAVLSLHGDLDADEWAELVREADVPAPGLVVVPEVSPSARGRVGPAAPCPDRPGRPGG